MLFTVAASVVQIRIQPPREFPIHFPPNLICTESRVAGNFLIALS